MTVSVRTATAEELPDLLPHLARLRIAVFRDWPYLYDGDASYEERYLATFAKSPGAVIAVARDGAEIVGAATGAPLAEHDAAFAEPLLAQGYDADAVFYCAESVLLPAYRGRGLGHAFFDHREAEAIRVGFRYAAFCAVVRPADHPARPPAYRPLDSFWRARGYVPLEGATVSYSWRDLGATEETQKPMQVWIRALSDGA